MRLVIMGLLTALGSSAGAQGLQDDPMAYQGCIHGCLSDFGFNSTEYPACISQRCEGGGGTSSPVAAATAPTQAPDGRWGIASVDNLGSGAVIQTSSAMLHLGCVSAGPAGPTAELTLQVPDIRSDRVLIAFVGAQSMVNMERSGAGTYRLRGSACDVPITDLRAASAAIVLEGYIESIAEGQDTVVSSGGMTYAIQQGQQLASIPGAITVPLSGSSAAIGQLVQSCPALAQDLAGSCY